ncbi:hypothetical protein EYF80_027177 [Liparis tanakae]|uniref:Uncharacterized protein n=1 Tax=Liparis tanakae TaxID=230148 RepID=A0A4Z2H9M2_9TELE|nr:hypothetical protein EYF80_027177 [Liparis tanakae]
MPFTVSPEMSLVAPPTQHCTGLHFNVVDKPLPVKPITHTEKDFDKGKHLSPALHSNGTHWPSLSLCPELQWRQRSAEEQSRQSAAQGSHRLLEEWNNPSGHTSRHWLWKRYLATQPCLCGCGLLPLYSSVNSSSVGVSMSVERGLSLRRDEYGCTEVPYSTTDRDRAAAERDSLPLINGSPVFNTAACHSVSTSRVAEQIKSHLREWTGTIRRCVKLPDSKLKYFRRKYRAARNILHSAVFWPQTPMAVAEEQINILKVFNVYFSVVNFWLSSHIWLFRLVSSQLIGSASRSDPARCSPQQHVYPCEKGNRRKERTFALEEEGQKPIMRVVEAQHAPERESMRPDDKRAFEGPVQQWQQPWEPRPMSPCGCLYIDVSGSGAPVTERRDQTLTDESDGEHFGRKDETKIEMERKRGVISRHGVHVVTIDIKAGLRVLEETQRSKRGMMTSIVPTEVRKAEPQPKHGTQPHNFSDCLSQVVLCGPAVASWHKDTSLPSIVAECQARESKRTNNGGRETTARTATVITEGRRGSPEKKKKRVDSQ